MNDLAEELSDAAHSSSDIALVQVTFADVAEAETIGAATVEARLAACVNIAAPCRSIYRWQDRVERAEEVPALFKTTIALAPALTQAIAARHSYDLPAIELLPASASRPLLDWIRGTTSPVVS